MEDLKRLPSVTRLHFIECAGNRHNGRQKTVQETHGMTSCSEWTGVLLSTLLKECWPERQRAEFKGTPQRMAHARFSYPWNWDGNETEILSRCIDEIGQVQPTREQIAQHWNVPFERNYRVPGLDNSVMPWKIAKDGSVTNGLA
jgi:Oxidoreductase molybdopterin binding domain